MSLPTKKQRQTVKSIDYDFSVFDKEVQNTPDDKFDLSVFDNAVKKKDTSIPFPSDDLIPLVSLENGSADLVKGSASVLSGEENTPSLFEDIRTSIKRGSEINFDMKATVGNLTSTDIKNYAVADPEKFNKIAKGIFPDSGDAFLKGDVAAQMLAENINTKAKAANLLEAKSHDATYYSNLDNIITRAAEPINNFFTNTGINYQIKPTKDIDEAKQQLQLLSDAERQSYKQRDIDKIVLKVTPVQGTMAGSPVNNTTEFDVSKMSGQQIEAWKTQDPDLYTKLIDAKSKVQNTDKLLSTIHTALSPIQTQLGDNLYSDAKNTNVKDLNKDYVRSIGEEIYKIKEPENYALYQKAGGYDNTKPESEQAYDSDLDKVNKEIMSNGYGALRGDVAATGTIGQYANIYANLKYLDYKFATPLVEETKHRIAAELKANGVTPSNATGEQKDAAALTLPIENQQVWFNKTKGTNNNDLPDTGFLYSAGNSFVKTGTNIVESGSVISPISWATLFMGVPSDKENAKEVLRNQMMSNVIGENPESKALYDELKSKQKEGTLTPQELNTLNDLSGFTNVRSAWDKFKDGSANMVGMVGAITMDAIPTLGASTISSNAVRGTEALITENAATKGLSDIPLLENVATNTSKTFAQKIGLPTDAQGIVNFAKNKNEMFVLMHHDNALKAMELFPENDSKKAWYTSITDVLSMALPNLLPTHQIGKLFTEESKSVVADIVEKLSTENLDKAVVDNMMKETAKKIVGKAATFVGETEKTAAEAALTMSLLNLGNNITQAILKPESITGNDVSNNFLQTFSSTFMDSQLIGLIGGHNAVQEKYGRVGTDAIYDATANINNINSVKFTIFKQEKSGELSEKQVNDKVSLLNTAAELRPAVDDLQKEENLTTSQSKRVFINLLNERILKNQVSKLRDAGSPESLIIPKEKRIQEINELTTKIIGREITVDNNYSIIDKPVQDISSQSNTNKNESQKSNSSTDGQQEIKLDEQQQSGDLPSENAQKRTTSQEEVAGKAASDNTDAASSTGIPVEDNVPPPTEINIPSGESDGGDVTKTPYKNDNPNATVDDDPFIGTTTETGKSGGIEYRSSFDISRRPGNSGEKLPFGKGYIFWNVSRKGKGGNFRELVKKKIDEHGVVYTLSGASDDVINASKRLIQTNPEYTSIEVKSEHGNYFAIGKKSELEKGRSSLSLTPDSKVEIKKVTATSIPDLLKEAAGIGAKEVKVTFNEAYNEADHGNFPEKLKQTLKGNKESIFNVVNEASDIIDLVKNNKDVKSIEFIPEKNEATKDNEVQQSTETKIAANEIIPESSSTTEETTPAGKEPPKPPIESTTQKEVDEHIGISKNSLKNDYGYEIAFPSKSYEHIADTNMARLKKVADKNGISVPQQAANEVAKMKNRKGESSEHDIVTAAFHLLNINEAIKKTTDNEVLDGLLSEQQNALEALRQLGNNAGRNLNLFGALFRKVSDDSISIIAKQIQKDLDVKDIPRTVKDLNESDLSAHDKKRARPYIEAIEQLTKEVADIQKKTKATLEDIDAKSLKEYVDKELAKRKKNKETKTETPLKGASEKREKQANKLTEWADKFENLGRADLPEGTEKKGISIDVQKMVANAMRFVAEEWKAGKNISEIIKDAIAKFGESVRNHLHKGLLENGFTEKEIYTDKEQSINKLIDMRDNEGAKNITKDMASKGVIDIIVNEHIKEDTPYDKVVSEATKELKEYLPDVTESDVKDAILKRGEFKRESKQKEATEFEKKKQDVKRVINTENKVNALTKAEEIHSINTDDSLSKEEKKKEIESRKSEYEKWLDKKLFDSETQKKQILADIKNSKENESKVKSGADKALRDVAKRSEKLNSINEEIDHVNRERAVFDRAIKDPKKTSEEIKSAKKELEDAYSRAGIRKESGGKTEIKIAKDAETAIGEIKNSDLPEDIKKEHISKIEEERDAQLNSTKQGVLTNLRENVGGLIDDVTSKINDAIDRGDKESKDNLADLKNDLQNLHDRLSPNTENLKDQIDKADQEVETILRNHKDGEFSYQIKELQNGYHKDWQKTYNELESQRLIDSETRSLEEAERRLNANQLTEIPTDKNEVLRNQALINEQATTQKAWKQLNSLRTKARNESKNIVDKLLSARRSFLIASFGAIEKVAGSAITKPFIDPLTKQTWGRIAGAITGVKPTSTKRLIDTYRQLKNEGAANRFMVERTNKYVDAIIAHEKALQSGNKDTIEAAKNKMDVAELNNASSMAYLFINAGSHIDIKQVLVNAATDFDAKIGKYHKSYAKERTKWQNVVYWLESVNRTHGAMKSISARQGLLDGYIENLQMAQKRDGAITPENRLEAWDMATLAEYEQGRFGEGTKLSNLISKGRSSENAALRATTNLLFPVAKISINIAKQGIDRALPIELAFKTLGSNAFRGVKLNAQDGIEFSNFSSKYYNGIKRGFDNLPLEQKKYINTLLTRGLAGLAQYALFGSLIAAGGIKYGGPYNSDDPFHKRYKIVKGSDGQPLAPGEWEFFGHRSPKLLNAVMNHSPYTLPASFAADYIAQTRGEDKKGQNGINAVRNVVNETMARLPFSGLLDLTAGLVGGDDYKLERSIANTVPSFKGTAEYFDTDAAGNPIKRTSDSKSFWGRTYDMWKTNIPFLRNNLPVKGEEDYTSDQMKSPEFKMLRQYNIEPPKLGGINQYNVDEDETHPSGKMNTKEFEVFKEERQKRINDGIANIYAKGLVLERKDFGKIEIDLTNKEETDALLKENNISKEDFKKQLDNKIKSVVDNANEDAKKTAVPIKEGVLKLESKVKH